MKRKRSLEARAQIFSALGEPTRLRIVEYLTGATEANGTQIADDIGISLALFCHHAKLLTTAGVLKKRRQGQGTYYSLDFDLIEGIARF